MREPSHRVGERPQRAIVQEGGGSGGGPRAYEARQALVATLLLVFALGGVFAQLAALREPGVPLLLFLALRLGPQLLLLAAAIGLVYHRRGCLLPAVLGLLISIAGDLLLFFTGRAVGISVGTALAAVLALALAWLLLRARAPHPR